MSALEGQVKQLEAAIAGLEAQRSGLGGAVLETALAPLRRQLSDLRRLTSPSPKLSWAGERKAVIVMFADLSGFTAMAERMDPEQVRNVINACFDRLVPVVEAYGGVVDKFIGDEIMALFGMPMAYRDEVKRALHAALDMMEALAAFNRDHSTALRLHIGVERGLVVAGGIGPPGRQQYSVMGEAVNLAAWLGKASGPGEILVGPALCRLATPWFDFERVSPAWEQDRDRPAAIYRLLGARPSLEAEGGLEEEPLPLVRAGGGNLAHALAHVAVEAHIAQLEEAIAKLEAQRAVLGDAAVQPALTPLHHRLAYLRKMATLAGERKLVTVMFANIPGFTAMSERMDPEHVRRLMNTCFDYLVPAIEKYEGTVDKFIGSRIMALFGAPVAHENHAERALRAALEMGEALAEFNARFGTDLRLHCGINSGLVVAGGIGSQGRQEYSVMGDAVNLAARLESAAEGGEIFVGPSTYRLTEPLFEFELLPPIRVKGKRKPVRVYRLRAARPAPGSTRGIEGLRSPLVGRDAEFDRLLGALRSLMAGQGGKVAIIGEAGLGKSRLVAEGRRWLRMLTGSGQEAGVTWVEGRCLSHTRGIGYWVARDVLHSLLGVSANAPANEVGMALRNSLTQLLPERIAEIYPYLALVLDVPLEPGMTERVKYLDAETLQQRIRESFRTYVRNRALERPLVVVWEDLHWADPSSLRLLEALLPLTDEVPLLLLLVFRPHEGRIWGLHQQCLVIELAPLSRDESTQLVSNLLKVENLPAETRELILDRAEGNPFYIEELLRSLIDAGIVVLQGGRAVVRREISAVDVPDTLQGVIMARIDRLSPADKRTLQTAAVIGRVFQARVLQHLVAAEGTESQLGASLEELQRREFIRPQGMGSSGGDGAREYIFKHALTQETAYSSLLIAQRQALHRRTGEVLERLFPDRADEYAATLGYHFEKAGVNDKAFRYFAHAGDHAATTYANEEAIEYFRTALELATKVSENVQEEQVLIYEHLGDVLVKTGAYDSALESYTAALDVLKALLLVGHGAERAAALYRKAGMVYESKGEYPVALEWLTRAQAMLPDGHHAEMARICTSVAGILYRQGEAAQSLQWCQRGLEIAQAVGEPQEMAHAYMLRGTIHGDLGDLDQAISDCLKSLDLARKAGDLLQQAKAHNGLGANYYYTGDWQPAEFHYRQSLEIRERIGDVTGMAMVSNNLGELYLNQGRFDEAAAHFRRCLETWERTGWLVGVPLSYRNLAQVAIRRREWDVALKYLKKSLCTLEEMGARDWLVAEVYRHLAEVHLGLGQWEAACECGRRALDIAVAQRIQLVEGSARRVLGQLYRCRGEWASAETFLEESLKLSEEQGQRYEIGQALFELGLLYLDRAGAEKDDETQMKAIAALDRAVVIFEELGARWDLARAQKLAVRLGDSA